MDCKVAFDFRKHLREKNYQFCGLAISISLCFFLGIGSSFSLHTKYALYTFRFKINRTGIIHWGCAFVSSKFMKIWKVYVDSHTASFKPLLALVTLNFATVRAWAYKRKNTIAQVNCPRESFKKATGYFHIVFILCIFTIPCGKIVRHRCSAKKKKKDYKFRYYYGYL